MSSPPKGYAALLAALGPRAADKNEAPDPATFAGFYPDAAPLPKTAVPPESAPNHQPDAYIAAIKNRINLLRPRLNQLLEALPEKDRPNLQSTLDEVILQEIPLIAQMHIAHRGDNAPATSPPETENAFEHYLTTTLPMVRQHLYDSYPESRFVQEEFFRAVESLAREVYAQCVPQGPAR